MHDLTNVIEGDEILICDEIRALWMTQSKKPQSKGLVFKNSHYYNGNLTRETQNFISVKLMERERGS